MNKITLIFLFAFFSFSLYAQQTIVKGSVKDAVSFQPILNVTVVLEGTDLSSLTDVQGEFLFSSNIPLGEQVLKISKAGYTTKRFPIIVYKGQTVDISDMTLERDISQSQDLFTITLSDDELDNDTSGADNITGLLSSSLDVFQRTAAFELANLSSG